MTRRNQSLLVSMALALIIATAFLALSAALEAPWLGAVAVVVVVFALVQRDRFLLQGAWLAIGAAVVVIVAIAFIVEQLT
jgi:hypothetical protein